MYNCTLSLGQKKAKTVMQLNRQIKITFYQAIVLLMVILASGVSLGGESVANMAAKAVNPRAEKMTQVIEDFLGKDHKMLINKAGDPIFVSSDGARKIRFDALNPHGYEPHGHVQVLKNGKWTDYIPDQHHIYLSPKVELDLLPPPIKK
jgi:hypothetical protein